MKKRTNQRLPPRGSCRQRRLKESARLSVFRRPSVPRAPFVTLTRDTFLPEEGSWRRAALPQKENVRLLVLNLGFFASPSVFPKLRHPSVAGTNCGAKRKTAAKISRFKQADLPFGRHRFCTVHYFKTLANLSKRFAFFTLQSKLPVRRFSAHN